MRVLIIFPQVAVCILKLLKEFLATNKHEQTRKIKFITDTKNQIYFVKFRVCSWINTLSKRV
jgi:hypothetical protein